MPELRCPSQADLLPLATGEPSDLDVTAHVSGCRDCQSLVELLRNEMQSLSSLVVPETAVETTVFYRQSLTPPLTSQSEDQQAPTMIGRYQVLGRLGSGGQADVFRAMHPTLVLDVVVKIGRLGAASDAASHNRLMEEGRLLSKLRHPHIACVYDLDFHEGRPFLALQYVRGVNLRQHVLGRLLPVDEIAELMCHVADALAAAHSRGIVHLDLKPENIVIDSSGAPMVIDFGLAQLRDAWSADDYQPHGGTPSFMAPEQARAFIGSSTVDGLPAEVGPAADIFGLGAVLYFLLTGLAPFSANDSTQSLERAAHCDFDAAALDQPLISKPIAAICHKALSTNPADRFSSAQELARQFQQMVEGPKRRTTARRWVMAGSVAGLLIALGLYTAGNRPSSRPVLEPSVVQASVRFRSAGPRGSFHDLTDRLPLASSDRLVIHMQLPAGHRVAILLVDADGRFQQIPAAELSVTQSDGAVDIDYPRPGRTAQWESPPGTCLLLICARPREEIDGRSLQLLLGGPWPGLPETDMSIEFDHNKVWLPGSRGTFTYDASEKPLVDRADTLRQQLAQQFDTVHAVVFHHQ